MQDVQTGVPDEEVRAETDAKKDRVMFRERSRVIHTQFQRMTKPEQSRLISGTFIQDIQGGERLCVVDLGLNGGRTLCRRATDESLVFYPPPAGSTTSTPNPNDPRSDQGALQPTRRECWVLQDGNLFVVIGSKS